MASPILFLTIRLTPRLASLHFLACQVGSDGLGSGRVAIGHDHHRNAGVPEIGRRRASHDGGHQNARLVLSRARHRAGRKGVAQHGVLQQRQMASRDYRRNAISSISPSSRPAWAPVLAKSIDEPNSGTTRIDMQPGQNGCGHFTPARFPGLKSRVIRRTIPFARSRVVV